MRTGLIGRTKECRALDGLVDAVRGGDSRVLVVRGDAGIGKSALLQHLTDAASGFRVLHATGVESEMELPFAALQQLCSPVLDHLAALPDPQRDAAGIAFGRITGSSPDRVLIGLAVLTLLSAASDDGPVLCIVDDAHWLDRDSAMTLAFVARRLLADSVGFVFATRHAIGDLGAFSELVVERLRDGDAHALLGTVLQFPLDERVRDRVVAETHGNPLALVEWPRGRTGAELAGGFGLPTLMPMTGRIEESFRRRLAELPEPTQRFLTVAAAEPTGDPVLVWRAASVLGISPLDATPAIHVGLVDIGVRVWFRHPLVRSAAYNAATLADRQAAHRALAAATDAELDPDRRAWHRALGCNGLDDDIADALEQSADRARARGGLPAAGALLERSLALTLDPSRRGARILAAAACHLEAGSFDAAAALLASAEAAALDEMGAAEIDLLRARHAAWGGDIGNAPALFYRASTGLELVAPEMAAVPFLQAMAIAHIVGDAATGVDPREIALAASKHSLPPEPSARDLLVVGLARLDVDGRKAAAPSLRRALDASTADAVHPDDMQILGFCAAAANVLWDLDSLHTLALALVATTRKQGALTMMPIALSTLAHAFVLRGDFDSAALALAESKQILDATGSTLSSYTSVAAEFAGLQAGDGAATLIDEHLAAARLGLRGPLMSALWASATLYNGAGQYSKAMDAATQAIANPLAWGTHVFFPELIEAAARCGRTRDALATREQLTEAAEVSGTDWALGVERRSEALFADGSAAEDLYREAIDRLSRTSLRPDLARRHLLYGEWLRRENRRVDARAQLRTAFELCTSIGMQGFGERACRELVATGETVRKRTSDSFDELTPQEAHIAGLAAGGHTNPEIGAQLFISPRTVEWHLRKVFTKLGVTSRRELRTALPRLAAVAATA